MTDGRVILDSASDLANILSGVARDARNADFENVLGPFCQSLAEREEQATAADQPLVGMVPMFSCPAATKKKGAARIQIVTEAIAPSLIHESRPDNRTPASARGLLFGPDFERASFEPETAPNVRANTDFARLEKELDRLVNQIADITVESMKSP